MLGVGAMAAVVGMLTPAWAQRFWAAVTASVVWLSIMIHQGLVLVMEMDVLASSSAEHALAIAGASEARNEVLLQTHLMSVRAQPDWPMASVVGVSWFWSDMFGLLDRSVVRTAQGGMAEICAEAVAAARATMATEVFIVNGR